MESSTGAEVYVAHRPFGLIDQEMTTTDGSQNTRNPRNLILIAAAMEGSMPTLNVHCAAWLVTTNSIALIGRHALTIQILAERYM